MGSDKAIQAGRALFIIELLLFFILLKYLILDQTHGDYKR